MTDVSPGLILILGALLVPMLRGSARSVYMLALPVLAFLHLVALPYGSFGTFEFLGLNLVTLRVDRLSSIFGYIFLIATLHVGHLLRCISETMSYSRRRAWSMPAAPSAPCLPAIW